MPITNFPDVRQKDGYSCGAAASMAVGLYYGVGPSTLDEWKKLLGTNVERSTDPQRIIDAFKKFGRKVVAKQMTIQDLDYSTSEQGAPVICPVQDYGRKKENRAVFSYGHYLTVIGVAMGYVVCQDSSEDNIIKPGSESIQAPGKIIVGASEWMKVWHDRDVYNQPYVNFGIAIS